MMMMMMMMVTDAKPPAPVSISTLFSSGLETVLHDTVLYMQKPPSPDSSIPDPNIEKIWEVQTYKKQDS
eukprot:2301588-Ditylum_brightwellii.AAC.1